MCETTPDSALAACLKSVAADYEIGGYTHTASQLREAAARILELSGRWHPSLDELAPKWETNFNVDHEISRLVGFMADQYRPYGGTNETETA